MEWFNRLGAMYNFFTETPALGHDLAQHGPDGDLAYHLAWVTQNTPDPINIYPDDATE